MTLAENRVEDARSGDLRPCLEGAEVVQYIPRVFAVYRIHADSLWHTFAVLPPHHVGRNAAAPNPVV